MISIAQPLCGVEEGKAVLEVIASGQLAQGERVTAFEHRFADLCTVKEAVAVSSGTAALQLALLAHNIGPGDEVITTPFSFAATANAILQVGATPVFVDIEADSYNIDPTLIEAAITARTKAILPVHLYGYPCDMERIEAIVRAHHLVLIEDACQAHVAAIAGKPVGSFGTGCFSFYPTKNMTTGEGGMVTTNDTEIAERIRILRNQGQRERYCQVALGYNLRMTDIAAALGLVQVEKLETFTKQRIANAAFLTSCLAEVVQTPKVLAGYRHVYHQYVIKVPQQRDEWAKKLHARGIGTGIHYPLAIHQQPFYQASPHLFRISRAGEPSRLLVAETVATQVLSLPVHPALSMADLQKIVEEVLELCG